MSTPISRFIDLLRTHGHRLLWLLLLGVLLLWGIFLKASSEIQEGEGFPGDVQVLRWVHAHATPALDNLNLLFTSVGGPLPMVGINLLIAGGLFWRKQRRHAWFFGVAVAGAASLNLLAKAILGRPRPAFWVSIALETSSSFPSGHSMAAIAAAVSFLLWRTHWRWPAVATGVHWAGGMGWSRMYLGVRYPSDVLAGWVGSVGWWAGCTYSSRTTSGSLA